MQIFHANDREAQFMTGMKVYVAEWAKNSIK